MRVALDGTPLLGARTGIAEMVDGLLRALAARDDVDPIAYALTWRGRRALAGALPPGVAAATRPLPARAVRALWSRLSVPTIERWTGPVDVVHALNFVAPPARAPVVLTIADVTFERFPELCTTDTLRYPAAIRRALARGAHVHVLSDFVGAEVREIYGLAPERIARVYPGLTARPAGDAFAGRSRAGSERYVLALGTVEPRKNLPLLVRAFDAVAQAEPELRLVIAGPDGWDTDALTSAIAAGRHGDRVVRPGYVDARTRADLLAGASVFAYPSLYEGFGFPPLEAMAAGVPVVASDAGPLPEVLGDAATLVAPHDQGALADALARALSDEELRSWLVAAGRTRAAGYRWDRAAEEIAALYARLGGR